MPVATDEASLLCLILHGNVGRGLRFTEYTQGTLFCPVSVESPHVDVFIYIRLFISCTCGCTTFRVVVAATWHASGL